MINELEKAEKLLDDVFHDIDVNEVDLSNESYERLGIVLATIRRALKKSSERRGVRKEIENREALMNPIFLLQSAKIVITEPQMLVYCSECEGVYKSFEGHDCENGSGILTSQQIVDLGWAEKIWITQSVWLDRAEAEKFARVKAHNFPDGHRVFSVPAEGKLAEVLNS